MLYDPKWEVEAPVEIKLEPWQEILLKAADLLERKGWCQNQFERLGSHCAVGAIGAAHNSKDNPVINYSLPEPVHQSVRILLEAVNNAERQKDMDARTAWQKLFGRIPATKLFSSVPEWNDEPERTKEEVVSIMRKAANVV
jgi:hypothetical protein